MHRLSPKIISSTILSSAEAKWLSLKKLIYLDQTGVQRQWEVAGRTTRRGNCDAVAIFPVLKSGQSPDKTVLIVQYRPPVDAHVVEFPAGLIDDGETAEIAAIRELKVR